MFAKIGKTNYPPKSRPIMVWDGECGFCEYWITNWKSNTGNKIDYQTYQEVAANFPDIPLKEFKKASRLIEADGKIYSGPNSAFRSFLYFQNPRPIWHNWYTDINWFTKVTDYAYNFIAKNRSFAFKITKIFFGKNPESLKPFWIVYLFLLFTLIYMFLSFL